MVAPRIPVVAVHVYALQAARTLSIVKSIPHEETPLRSPKLSLELGRPKEVCSAPARRLHRVCRCPGRAGEIHLKRLLSAILFETIQELFHLGLDRISPYRFIRYFTV
jgi:hypothetical protein